MSTDAEVTLPILTLLQRIKDGVTDPRILDRETRQALVEAMIGEGVTQAQIAVHLKCSDKTIQRDVQEIRQKNALLVTPEFVRETIGEMVGKARIHGSRLMQLSRSGSGSVMEKAQAELYAWQVWAGCVTKLQSLGCLPQKAQEIIGDIYHHQSEESDEESLNQIEEAIKDIDLTTKGKKDAEAKKVKKDLRQLRVRLEKTRLLTDLKKVAAKAKEMKESADVEAKGEDA